VGRTRTQSSVSIGLGCLLILLTVLAASACSQRGRDEKVAARWIAYTKYRASRDEVWISRIDGSGKRRLATGLASAISPDGRWVAFGGNCEPELTHYCPDLYVVGTSGGKPRLLARRAAAEGAVVWSPDSARLAALRSVSDERRALITVAVASGDAVVLARGDATGFAGWSFSPSGNEIAYSLGADLYVADADGGSARRLTRDGTSGFPVWGRDGIAFARFVPYRGWGRHEIWRIDADGTGRRTITGPVPRGLLGQGIEGLIPVAWSADGTRLLAALLNEFGGVPYSVNPSTGAIRRVGDYSFHAWPDGLSRDGRFVLVEDGGVELDDFQRIEVVRYGGGRIRVLARRAGAASWNG
jgi:Tol biopolymer transport system component